MDDSDLMGSLQSGADLDHDREGAADRQRDRLALLDTQHLRQRGAIDQLHGQELFTQVLADVVHARDVAVGDAAGQANLGTEAVEDARQADDFAAQHFERDRLAQLDVECAVDGASAAGANQSLELVATAKQGRDNFRAVVEGWSAAGSLSGLHGAGACLRLRGLSLHHRLPIYQANHPARRTLADAARTGTLSTLTPLCVAYFWWQVTPSAGSGV